MATAAAAAATATAAPEEERTLQEELSLPIILADRVSKSAQEAESSKFECSELAKQVDRLSQMLRTFVRLSTNSSSTVYDRPVRRICCDITKTLERALSLTRKCRHSGPLRHLFSITTTADFRKVSNLLESSIGDMRWLLSLFDSDGANLSLPPIASNDPILAWVWSYISTIHMGPLKDRVDAANELASLAKDNDRNKKMIVEEGGISPLLKLLKEGASPEAQIAAANTLYNIATDEERVRLIVDVMGIPIIVAVLGEAQMKVQIVVANLVARMAEMDSVAREEFVRENVTRKLVSLLSADLVLEVAKPQAAKTSIHSLVQMNKEMTDKSTRNPKLLSVHTSSFSDGSSRGRKEREAESPEVKLKLQVSCAEALWKLSKGSLATSRKITETRGLLCLAKIIERESGDLQFNCLMTIMEITAVAESNADLRRAAFKTNSPAAKAVLDQLLRVIQEESSPTLQIPAIKSIGCLARTFPARETRIIGPLVDKLSNSNVEVAMEAANALGKFASPENFNGSEHSKAIIEFGGVPPLMKLLRSNDQAQVPGLVLLCYLALNAGNSKALEQARALNALEGAARSVVTQHPDLRELFAKAIHHLTLYQAGGHPHRQTFAL
ncbi:Armadillo [Corchorus olitorius]|uniref:Armadillo n=1 Tax=Corchorus olitorius TaxID=93759 RepID=A0A1R3HAS2_9ROSI|nr:Armadillo [Corchorus olitorius]